MAQEGSQANHHGSTEEWLHSVIGISQLIKYINFDKLPQD